MLKTWLWGHKPAAKQSAHWLTGEEITDCQKAKIALRVVAYFLYAQIKLKQRLTGFWIRLLVHF